MAYPKALAETAEKVGWDDPLHFGLKPVWIVAFCGVVERVKCVVLTTLAVLKLLVLGSGQQAFELAPGLGRVERMPDAVNAPRIVRLCEDQGVGIVRNAAAEDRFHHALFSRRHHIASPVPCGTGERSMCDNGANSV